MTSRTLTVYKPMRNRCNGNVTPKLGCTRSPVRSFQVVVGIAHGSPVAGLTSVCSHGVAGIALCAKRISTINGPDAESTPPGQEQSHRQMDATPI